MNSKAARAARRLAERNIANQLHTITILTRHEDGQQIFQWGGNNGVWFSPTFTDMHIAFRYPLDIGLKVQEENPSDGMER